MLEFALSVYDYFSANLLELIATIFGIVCVYLNTKENIWGWPTGIVSVALYVYIFWEVALVSDSLLNFFYVIVGFYGWYNWRKGGADRQELPVSISSRKELYLLLGVGAVSTFLWGKAVETFYPAAALPYWDATTTCFSLVAQWQLAKKRLENWLVWIFVDTLAVGIYFVKELYITSFLYGVFLFLAAYGYWEWKKNFNEKKS